MNTALILLGCNVGNCESNFKRSIELLEINCGEITAASSIYQTAPWGYQDQDYFLNQVLQINTTLNPEELLVQTSKIENELGRIRQEINGPRKIDIDILFFNDLQVITNTLIIPHPRLHLRKFTLIPLNEIIPNYIHPVYQISISELLIACPDESDVKLKEDN
jgi:2-amino-4-hydroxy-6-hydroxymethyldihydropteridine diphosphokinase